MKKNFITKIAGGFFSIGFACSLLSSCEKKQNTVLPKSENDLAFTNLAVKVEDGRIKFNNWDEMKQLLNSVNARSPEILNRYIGDKFVSHFESVKAARLNVDEEDSIGLKNSPIREHFYASLLNKDRELEVGNDTIFKIGNDYCFYYKKGDVALVENFYQDLRSGKLSNVPPGELKTYYDSRLGIYGTIIKAMSAKLSNGTKANKSSKVLGSEESYYFDSDHRMTGKFYTHSYLGYATVGVQTLMERCNKFLWWSSWGSDDADFLSVNFLGGVYSLSTKLGFSLVIPTGPRFQSETRNSEAYVRIDYFVGFFPSFDWQNGQSEYTVQYGPLRHTIFSTY